MMTHDQRELVSMSLDRLSDVADPVTLLLYGKLFELDPSVRRLLHNHLTAHFESLRPRLARLPTPARQLRRPAGSPTTP